jgi:DNA-binding transcriptional LysR family regulator
MDYDALMAFATFAEYLNFTHAAEELHISQPALHRKVNKLADRLETPLYVRSGRDLVLTEEGEMLAAHAREVASMTDNVLARLDEEEAPSPVVLASGPGAFLHLLGPAILEAREGPYPLRLLTMRSPAAAKAVIEARAHVAVGVFHEGYERLEVEVWREIGQKVVVPEEHWLAGRGRLEPTDLEGEQLVIAPAGQPHRVSTEQVLAEHDVGWSVGVEATGWQLMMRFVTYGMGITIINDFVPVPEGLVGIPVEGFPVVDYSVATRPDTRHGGADWLRGLITGS